MAAHRRDLASLALVLTVALGAAARADDDEPARAAQVEAAPPRRGRIARLVVARGALEPMPGRTFALTSPDAQAVERVDVEPGQRVRAGDVLVRIHMDPAARLAHERAEIGRGQAELQAGRLRRLVAEGVVPRARLDEAEAVLGLAEAEERAAREALDYATSRHTLTSPIDGVVSSVDAIVGATCDPTRPLVRVIDPSALVAALRLPLSEAAAIHSGQHVDLVAPATGAVHAGTVTSVGRAASAEQAVEVRVALRSSDGLVAGAFTLARIEVEVHEDALLVAPSAVLRVDALPPAVFVVRDGKAARIEVELGLETKEAVELIAGVALEDLVIVQGAYELTDGAAVQVAPPVDPGAGARPGPGR